MKTKLHQAIVFTLKPKLSEDNNSSQFGVASFESREKMNLNNATNIPRFYGSKASERMTLKSLSTLPVSKLNPTTGCGLRQDQRQRSRQEYLCSIWSHHTLLLPTGPLMHEFPAETTQKPKLMRQVQNTPFYKIHVMKLTRSSLLVRLVVSAFWLASSSRMRLHLVAINN